MVPIFACDECGEIKFKKDSRFRPTWQRCKKCGAEYVSGGTKFGIPSWTRTR
jgi:hypothetical protein